MDLTQREWEQLAAAIERMSARNGYRIPLPGETLSAREQNILLQELGFSTKPDTDPDRTVQDVSADILNEFEQRRQLQPGDSNG